MSASDPKPTSGQPVRIAIVSVLDGRADVALRFLVLRLNVVQESFEFEFLPYTAQDEFIKMLSRHAILDRQSVRTDGDAFYERHSRLMSEWAEEYRLAAEAPDRLIVLSTARFSDNYFVTRTRRLSIIALGNWNREMAPPTLVEFFVSLIISEAINAAVPALRGTGHIGTKGCKLDFSAFLGDARQQVLSPFLCHSCRSRLAADGKAYFAPAIDAMLDSSWLGSPTEPNSPAAIASALGHDLFTIKGLRPTPWETLKATVLQEGFRQVLALAQTVLAAILVAAFLVYLGLK